MTLSNMAAEMGAKNGYFEVDNQTLAWLKDRPAPASNRRLRSDAAYEAVLDYDLRLGAQMLPHTVDNVKPVREVAAGPSIKPYRTCTNAG